MSSRMRATRGHTRNTRSHHALKEPRLSTCDNCGEAHIRHRMCPTCGIYRGRTVVDMEAKIAKKQEKMKRKNQELKELGVKKDDDEANPLKEKKVVQKGPEEGEKQQLKKRRGPLDLMGLSKRPEK